MPLSPAERVALGLDMPDEFTRYGGETPQANGGAMTLLPATQVDRTPNLKLLLSDDAKVTSPRIRTMVNELLAGNMANADQALKALFAVNPKVALELYIELAQFSLPKLKAVAVAIDDRSDNPRSMGFAELQKMLAGDG